MFSDSECEEWVLKGLRKVVSEHLSAAALLTFFYLNDKKFKFPAPEADYLNLSPHFQKWTRHGNSYYQGFVTKKGVPDGRGIRIKDGALKIGNFKEGLAHGFCIKIIKDGSLQQGRQVEGKAEGEWLIRKPDGSTLTLVYKNGRLCQNSKSPEN